MFIRLPRYLRESVRGRLTLLVAIVTAPTALLAAVLILQSYRNARDLIERHLKATAKSFTIQIDHQFSEREDLLKALLRSPALEREDWAAFHAEAKAISTSDDQWFVLINRSGQQLVNTALALGEPLPRADLTPEFVEASERGRTYISNLTMSPSRKKFRAFVSVPVFRQGRLRYNLYVSVFPEALSTWMLSGEAPSSWIISLLDREGTIVARNHLSNTFVGAKASPPVLRAMKTSTDETIFPARTLEGIDVLTAFSRSPASGWSVAVGVPRRELYASAERLLYLAVAISSLSFVLLVAMAVWVARGLTDAVTALVADADALGAGKILTSSKTGMKEIDLVGAALMSAGHQLAARENDLKHLNETLDARVQTRTQELANANRELENFARIASHDLKEPLRLMTTYAGILRTEYEDRLDETGRLYLERIEAAGERQRALVSDILAYSRVLNLPPPSETVDLNLVLAAVCEDYEIRLKETSGKIEAGALGKIQGDTVQIRQLFGNLIGNSLKFHRDGIPPVVKIRSFEEAGKIHLVFEDNGIGFDRRYATKIFSPFERLHSGKKYEGTGMGLAIVRMIAERHGGTVEAESELGQGSRFEVILQTKLAGTAA